MSSLSGDVVSLDVAKRLKELAFNEVCLLHWITWNEGYSVGLSSIPSEVYNMSNSTLDNMHGGTIPDEKLYAAPARGQVIDWLMGKGLSVNVFQDDDSEEPWTYEVYRINDKGENEECLVHHTGEYWSRRDWRKAWDKAFLVALGYL